MTYHHDGVSLCIDIACLADSIPVFVLIFFFNDTATTEIYTLSLHDALPISASRKYDANATITLASPLRKFLGSDRSEEHTSELQSQSNLVCRLLLEKKNNICFSSHAIVTLRTEQIGDQIHMTQSTCSVPFSH